MDHNSHIVRTKETSSWATVGPATDKHEAPTHQFRSNIRAIIENSEFDQKIPQSQTEDKPVAPRGSGSDFRLYDRANFKTYLLMRW